MMSRTWSHSCVMSDSDESGMEKERFCDDGSLSILLKVFLSSESRSKAIFVVM